jgi:hypothetical protein
MDDRCEASLRSNYENFGDSFLGMAYIRSMFTVFDYVEDDMYIVPPTLGIASMVEKSKATERYELFYRNRME